jgi:hypothetical protein
VWAAFFSEIRHPNEPAIFLEEKRAFVAEQPIGRNEFGTGIALS